ncbi:MAG: C40 family peptidase [Rhodobacteraceae bacterium]|nr:C40 family peptidase [Paracoccaceae bacterium]
MSDPRALLSNGRVAHVSLRGQVTAERFTEGRWLRVCVPVAPLRDAPRALGGRRQRELVLHERFLALEEAPEGVFGAAGREGYVGWMDPEALAPDTAPMTHVVCARQSYLACVPVLKDARDEVEPVSFGTAFRVSATHEDGRWAEVGRLRPVAARDGHKAEWTAFIPAAHLRPLDQPESDPVAVALRHLGTPYHWGGNSGFGIDCSGLVQAAHLACGMACPGDSDQQRARLGVALAPDAPLRRGDAVFWPGHVGLMVDANTFVHATAHGMAVVAEPLATVEARIGTRALARRP